jgi:hypothetical protein
MTVVYFDIGGGVLPVLGQFVLPAVVGVVVVLVVVRDFRRRGTERGRGGDEEVLPLLIVPREGAPRAGIQPAPLPAPRALPERVPTPVPAPVEIPRFSPLPREPELDPGSETVSIDLIGAGTVQLLPGRLEVLRGMEAGREFRFIRSAGQLVTEVTLGRTTGPVHRHIQLPVPTVSRMHARMRHEDGRWTITNLSLTNPLRVNGRELFGREDSKSLESGDRITIGEVELCFWEEG